MITGGFGLSMDLETGRTRHWVMGRDGIQRWADTGQPINPPAKPAQLEKHVNLKDLPAVGQPLQAGIFAGVTTTRDGQHCAVVLLADKPAADMAWAKAMEWALGLDAQVPTRPVAALLFANLKPQFAEEWHWTSEELGGSGAWYQGFGSGIQSYTRKSYEACARAVRLIQLDA